MAKQFIVYGSGVFANVVKGIIEDRGDKFIGFIDDFNDGEEVIGNFRTVLSQYPPEDFSMAMGVGYKHFEQRWKLFRIARKSGYEFPALIHPKAYIHSQAKISSGAIVMATAYVDKSAIISELSVIWPGTLINHDSVIGENTFASPGTVVCGCVSVGRSVFIGAGAVITDHLEIGDDVFFRAGEIVTEHSVRRKRQ